ncbi:MAG TPA: arginine repressor [Candidatus Limnocylindrales bacterium]|nr:arginine repressor [Candidatus Limnocylindrales bacterium]
MDAMKRARQQAIGDVVRSHRIRTQLELVAALRDRGYRATQATVSRDVSEMGLLKVSRDGTQAYALPTSEAAVELTGEQRLAGLLRDLPIDIRASGTLLVIRAVPGSAHAIAAALDRARWPDILGTIAGDDTLFVACADAQTVARVRQRLLRLGQ